MSEENSVLVERDGPGHHRFHQPPALPQRRRRRDRRGSCTTPFLPLMPTRSASVAVFTGTGGYFCAGADLKAVAAGDPNKKRELGGHDSIAPMGPSRLRLSKP
jgi:enoyl-CoA hydratase